MYARTNGTRHTNKPTTSAAPAALLTQHSLVRFSTPHPETLVTLLRAQDWRTWSESPKDWLLVKDGAMIGVGINGHIQAMGEDAELFMANLTSWVGGLLAGMERVRKSMDVCYCCQAAYGYPVSVDGDTLCEECYRRRS